MSVIFMRILERRSASYDAGLKRFSGVDWSLLRERIKSQIKPGEKVLEIGCGPGTLAIEMASRGAAVTAIDANPAMVEHAQTKAGEAGVAVDFRYLPAERLHEIEGRYDWVVASLSFSEMRPVVRQAALVRLRGLLAEQGRLAVVDEIVPDTPAAAIRYQLSRLLWGLLTWLWTGEGTRPLTDFQRELTDAGYKIIREETLSPGSLRLWEVAAEPQATGADPGSLRAGWNLPDWVMYLFLWLTSHFLKVPVRPGLYRVGNPGPDSPLLATCNYLLSINLLRRYLKARDVWLLVNDTRGVNVWCSAGEGNFSSQEIALTAAASRVQERVRTREMILPKLCLNGVKVRQVRELTGLRARIGPVYASDLPAFLDAGLEKTERMEIIRFGFFNRLWFGVPFAVLMFLITGILTLFFHGMLWRNMPYWFAVTCLLVAATYTWLPTRRHLVKGLVLGSVMGLAALLFMLWEGDPGLAAAKSGMLLLELGLFVTADFSGSTPVSNRTLVEQEFKPIYILLAVLHLIYLNLSRIAEMI